MVDVAEAIQWSGTAAVVSMFVISGAAELPDVGMAHAGSVPTKVRRYRLEDDREPATVYPVHEFDAWLAEPPKALAEYLESCLMEALWSGGMVAWLGFEGTFHFEHLLTDEIAAHVYGVADVTGVSVALFGADRGSIGWRERVRACRSTLL